VPERKRTLDKPKGGDTGKIEGGFGCERHEIGIGDDQKTLHWEVVEGRMDAARCLAHPASRSKIGIRKSN